MKDYSYCNLFNLGDIGNEFSFEQVELKDPVKKLGTDEFTYKKVVNKFIVKNSQNIEKISGNKPLAIITIKNGIDLLKFTVEKLEKNYVFDDVDFIIVDDRSDDNSILDFCNEKRIPYVRVENSLNEFNFSVLNNIGAYFAKKAGCEDIILWNSDLWPEDKETVRNVYEKHKKNVSTISGTKLLYPLVSYDGKSEDTENVNFHFPEQMGKWRGTVQFGGGRYHIDRKIKPFHVGRFLDKNKTIVNCDTCCDWITGAFMIIDLNYFYKSGGLCCSLANQSQDVEFCYRAILDDKRIMYFGRDNQLYHDESLIQYKEKTKLSAQVNIDESIFSRMVSSRSFYEKLDV